MQLVAEPDNLLKIYFFSPKFNRLISQILCLCLFLFCQKANSDLVPSSMKDIIEKSDVILFANPTSIKTTDSAGSGYAEFVTEKSIKGKAISTFQITWSGEVHDQKIDNDKLHLLFLRRKANGEYTGTHYGRSYWPVEKKYEKDVECRLFTKYSYPISTINIDSEYIEAGFFIEKFLSERDELISILCLDRVQSIFEDTRKL